MPETLKIIENELGSYLAQNPQFLGFAGFQWNYGDEENGTAAKDAREKQNEKAAAWVGDI